MRNTDINSILFPVKLEKVYYKTGDGEMLPIGESQVLINAKTKRPISVVGKGYRLVSNEEAIEQAKKCFRGLFQTTNTNDMEVFNVINPQTMSFCHIDIIHKTYTVNIWEQEVYVPYIRITNSYNRSRALSFDIGFCRKLCDNGMIFEKKTIKFKYSHTKQEIGVDFDFEIEKDALKKLEIEFISYMQGLKKILIDRKYAMPIMYKVFDLDYDIENQKPETRQREREKLYNFKQHTSFLIDRYNNQLGENAYSLFNAITDYASNRSEGNRNNIVVNGLQRRAGIWAESFAEEVKKQDFTYEDYLGKNLQLFLN